MLTIVMYHYVRDLRRSRYPRINGLSIADFRGQLDYIARHYAVVRMEEVIAAAQGQAAALPSNAVLLTFDDGFTDHYSRVFPLLDERGWQGSFFPPARSILHQQVLDVHKIHFLLAAVADPQELVQHVFQGLDKRRREFDLPSNEDYFHRLARGTRLDPPEVIFIKRMLQRELPEPLRRELTEALFRHFVSENEAAFAAELYMSPEQLRLLQRHGMYVGNHGATHRWLNALARGEQEREIEESLAALEQLGAATESWVMCYPYGAHDDGLRGVLRERGCVLGLTTEVALADLARHDPLALPRLDTNDLPKAAAAPPCDWTRRVGLAR